MYEKYDKTELIYNAINVHDGDYASTVVFGVSVKQSGETVPLAYTDEAKNILAKLKAEEQAENLTDAQINEAAKNHDTANALEQLGAKIEDGKVTSPDAETDDWLKRHVIIAIIPSEPKSSKRGEGNTEIKNFVAPKDLTEQQRVYQRLGKDMGVRVVFFDNKNADFHGAHIGNISYINVNSKMPVSQVFWHESGHWLKTNNLELWQRLRKAAGITDAQRQAYLEETGRTDLTTSEEIDEDIISDYMEDTLKQEGFLSDIGRKDKSLIQRVVAWLRDMMSKFFEYFNNPKGKLTNDQKKRMAHEFGRMAKNIVDQNGNKIFRYNNRTNALELATGEKLENIDQSKYSIDDIKKVVKGSKAEFEKLQSTKPILVGNEISTGATGNRLKIVASNTFASKYPQGVTVDTKIGAVEINKASIKKSLGHSLYPAKANAVMSLPEGMRSAAYIGKLADLDGKPIENHYFVYPIKHEGTTRLVFCRVREQFNERKFYVHDVFLEDEINTKRDALSLPQPPTDRQVQLRGVPLYRQILAEFFAEGKRKPSDEKNNVAEQFGGRYEDGRLTFDNAEDADAYAQNVQNMERGEFKYSFTGETSSTSTTEKLKVKIDNLLWSVKNERPRNHMRKLLEKLSGYKIRTGHVAEGIDILVKDISKVIRTPNAYEWKKLLPEIGKLVAKRLNLNPTTEQGNYIASWLMDNPVIYDSSGATWTVTGFPLVPERGKLLLPGGSKLVGGFTLNPRADSGFFFYAAVTPLNINSAAQHIFELYSAAKVRLVLYINASNKFCVYFNSAALLTDTVTLTSGTTYYPSVDLYNGSLSLRVSSREVGTKTCNMTSADYTMYLGSRYNATESFYGYLSNVNLNTPESDEHYLRFGS